MKAAQRQEFRHYASPLSSREEKRAAWQTWVSFNSDLVHCTHMNPGGCWEFSQRSFVSRTFRLSRRGFKTPRSKPNLDPINESALSEPVTSRLPSVVCVAEAPYVYSHKEDLTTENFPFFLFVLFEKDKPKRWNEAVFIVSSLTWKTTEKENPRSETQV